MIGAANRLGRPPGEGPRRGQQGIAIPVVLWVMVMMLAFAGVAATAANTSQHSSQYQKSRDAALAAADTALNAALYRLNQMHPAPDRCANYVPLTGSSGPLTLRNSTPVGSTPDTNGVRWCPAETTNLAAEGDASATVRVSEGISVSQAGGCQTLQKRYIVATGTDRDNLVSGGRGVSRTLYLGVTNSAFNALFTNCGVMIDDWLHLTSKSSIESEVAVGTWTYLESQSVLCGTLNMYTPYPYSNPNQMRPAYPTPGTTATTLCNGPVYHANDGVALDEIPMPKLSQTENAGNSLSGLGLIGNSSDVCFFEPCTQSGYHVTDTSRRCAFDVGTDNATTGAGSNYSYDAAKRELILKGGSGSSGKCAAALILKPGGQYRFCRLTIQGGARLVVPNVGVTPQGGQTDTPTRIWIEDNQQPDSGTYPGESKCTSTINNRLSITAAGKIDNKTGDPSSLIIFGKGQKMRNNGTPDSNFYHMCFCSKYYEAGGATGEPQQLVVWAPHYQVDMQRLSGINGGMAAGRLYMRNRSSFTWDESVADLGQDQLKIGINYSPAQGTWAECGKNASFSTTTAPAATC